MKRIAIDVGHADGSGARGNGLEEHAVCSEIAVALKECLESFRLQSFGAEVVDFPERGNSGDLVATVQAVNAGGYDACVSLHMDAASRIAGYERIICDDGSVESEPIYEPDPVPHGAHACYYSCKGKKLAKEIALRLCGQLPGRAQQVVQRTDLYVLRKTKPVAVLVECGFITHAGDAAWVKAHVVEVARAIALGVAAYFDYEEGEV